MLYGKLSEGSEEEVEHVHSDGSDERPSSVKSKKVSKIRKSRLQAERQCGEDVQSAAEREKLSSRNVWDRDGLAPSIRGSRGDQRREHMGEREAFDVVVPCLSRNMAASRSSVTSCAALEDGFEAGRLGTSIREGVRSVEDLNWEASHDMD